jgi:tRNA G10  N-methylase Trm11
MIEKLEKQNTWGECLEKLNELIDAVNAIQKEREAERFEIQEWIGILEAVRKSVNVHEKQIDELQMKTEPEKCEIRSENVQPVAETRSENVHAVCPAVKYIGKVCRFWNGDNGKKFKNIGVLIEILSADNKRRYTCASKPKKHFEFCEPVKPDDDIIYKGE